MSKLGTLLLVRRDERSRAFYFCILFSLIGAGLAIGRSTADALFFKRYGIENLPFMYGMLSVVFVVVSIAYASVADRLTAERVFKNILVALLVLVSTCWLMIAYTQWEAAYPVYFVVYEIASELLLLHGAFYIGQNFETLQSKRLSPLMFGSAQIGTIAGGMFVAGATLVVGVQDILLAWCAITIVSILVIQSYHAKKGRSPYFQRRNLARNAFSASVQEIMQGLHFTRTSALLRASSYALFFMVVAFYIMCYTLNKIYTETFPTEEELGQFFGLLTAVTSAIALLVQFFVTGRLLRRFGVKKLNMVFPAGGIFTYLGLLVVFSFPAALFGSFVRDVLMPAIRRPTRNLFFYALPDYIQGRARAVAVSLVLPLALAITSGILITFEDSATTFLTIGLIANLIYLYFALRMNKEYVSELVGKLRDRLFLPDEGMEELLSDSSGEVLQELQRGVQHDDDALAYGYAKRLVACNSERAKEAILSRIERASVEYQDRMLRLMADHDLQAAAAYCRDHIDEAEDGHFKATMFKVLIKSDYQIPIEELENLLGDANPRLAAMGILGVFELNIDSLKDIASNRWRDMLSGDNEEGYISALELLGPIDVREHYPVLLEALRSNDARRQLMAMQVIQTCTYKHPTDQLESALVVAMESPHADVRTAAVQCFRLLPDDIRDERCLTALEDPHIEVRRAAVETMDDGSDDFKLMLCGWIIGNAGSPRTQKAILTYLGQCQVPETALWEIVFAKADDAGYIKEALCNLSALLADSEDAGKWRLLKLTLEERKKQVLNLALQALERVEAQEDIRMINAGVNSKDNRHFASAIEALSHIGNKSLANKLIGLLEENPDEKWGPDKIKSGLGVKEILKWCADRPDPWLRECVVYVGSQLEPSV